jgi:hypothetical protein
MIFLPSLFEIGENDGNLASRNPDAEIARKAVAKAASALLFA